MSKSIVITCGDPAGCGPYITLKSLENIDLPGAGFVVVGDKAVLDKIPVSSRVLSKLEIIDCRTPGIRRLKKGRATELSGRASLDYLDTALDLVSKAKIPALATAPLSKEAVQMVLPGFRGHTEYLADFFGTKKISMLMASPRLNTVLLTRHIPLAEVPRSLSLKLITDTVDLIYDFFKKRYKISRPKLAITGFNPHAGKDTFLGQEERIIARAVARCKNKLSGPFPSDTLFVPQRLKQFDCIICCYHDQAMIPFKLLSFSDGVNVTVGLPVLRTSPAHGTAFDAVRRRAPLEISSMQAALKYAFKYGYAKK